MIYLRVGNSVQELRAWYNMLDDDGLGVVDSTEEVVWMATPPPVPEEIYLTFISKANGNTFKFSGSSASNTLQYSLDNGYTWSTLAHDTYSPQVDSGHAIMFKASGLTINSSNGIGKFSSTGQFEVEGNAMSLLFGDEFIGQTSLAGKDSAFTYLFSACTGLTTAENLSLPATTLDSRCYCGMFSDCTNLATAPELPATTLADDCYISMFDGCTNLTTAPELPATTLGYYCYFGMFYGCTSLTTAPELPATTLAGGCYYSMFQGCTSLTTAPELPATTLADDCYYGMFFGCTSLNYVKCLASSGMTSSYCLTNWLSGVASSGTFVKSPNATTGSSTGASQWKLNDASGIPSNWTVVDAS